MKTLNPDNRPENVREIIRNRYTSLEAANGLYVFSGSNYYVFELKDFHEKFGNKAPVVDFDTNRILETDKREHISVLDIGSASGNFLRANGSEKIACTGLCAESRFKDIPGTVIGDANHLKEIPGLKDQKFDYIVSSITFRHIADPLGALVQAYDMLNNDGYLVVDGFYTPGIEQNLDKIFYYLSHQGYEIFTHLSPKIHEYIERKPKYTSPEWFKPLLPGLQVNCLIIKKTKLKQTLDLPVSYDTANNKINYALSDDLLFNLMPAHDVRSYWDNQNKFPVYFINRLFSRSIIPFEMTSTMNGTIRVAAKVGDTAAIKQIVKKHGTDILVDNHTVETESILHTAIKNRHLETSLYLLEQLKKIDSGAVSYVDNRGFTLAHCCAEAGEKFNDMCLKILEIEPELREALNKNGHTLLKIAIEKQNSTLVRKLYSITNPEILTSSLQTLFHEEPNIEIKLSPTDKPNYLLFTVRGKDGNILMDRKYSFYFPQVLAQHEIYAQTSIKTKDECFEINIPYYNVPRLIKAAEETDLELQRPAPGR